MKHAHFPSAWQVQIAGLVASTRVGLHAHEHAGPQPVVLDIELDYRADLSADKAAPFIDYDGYCASVCDFLGGKPHVSLLETVATEVAALSFHGLPALEQIRIAIHKPKIRENAARVGVAICWTRCAYEVSGHASVHVELVDAPHEVSTSSV